jgi:hypothetical protein
MSKFINYLLEESDYEEVDPEEFDEFYNDLNKKLFDFLELLDIESLSEDQADALEDLLELIEDSTIEEIDEVAKINVIRGGKRVKKLPPKKGYKVINGKYVRMSASEKRVRSKAAKRSARKLKSKKSSISRKRKKSMKKRT